MFSAIIQKLKEILAKMIGGRTIEKELHIAPTISTVMEDAIKDWVDMYKDQSAWLREATYDNPVRIASLGLPAMIASEKARMALLEFKSEITTPTEEVEVKNPDYKEPEPDIFGNIIPSAQPPVITQEKPKTSTKRAEYLNKQYEKLKKSLRVNVEKGIALGGLVIKPYVVSNGTDEKNATIELEFDFVHADAFYPLSFDANKKITEAAFLETKQGKDIIYRRLEYHQWKNNSVKVINKAFKSLNNQNASVDLMGIDLGQEVPLTEVPEWKDLPPSVTIEGVEKPLFAYFKMPEANTIDLNSPLGVSGYARAKSLIKDADMQYSRLLWEYEGGELAIDIDRDALRIETDSKGRDITVRPMGQQRLFRKVDISQTGETYFPYAPSLRDASYNAGLNTILMRIEDVCAISRGTLSDAAAEARTATELKILKQRSYQANAEIQQAIEDCLKDVIYIMNAYCNLYEITPDGEYDVNFEWDDSIIVDVDMELQKRILLMQNGLASKVENRMWYFGETERQAKEALMKIQEEGNADMQQDLVMHANEINMNRQEEPNRQEVRE